MYFKAKGVCCTELRKCMLPACLSACHRRCCCRSCTLLQPDTRKTGGDDDDYSYFAALI